MTDRRRINAPSGGTSTPIFARTVKDPDSLHTLRPTRARQPDELRKIFLKTGLTPSASGSAYLEIPPADPPTTPSPPASLIPPRSSLKLACAVHGPKPLPRSAPFSPHLILTTTVKFAPFAARARRGYIRDASERDLGVHLETALRGVVIGERWPKSGVEVVVTVLEAEEDVWWGDEFTAGLGRTGGWGLMTVLAGCVTVASAAIADAGIDCVDLVSGGVAAIVRNPDAKGKGRSEGEAETKTEGPYTVLDPCPAEHQEIVAGCVVGYLPGRDEITALWMKGEAGEFAEQVVDRAVQASIATMTVLKEAVKEAAELKFQGSAGGDKGIKSLGVSNDVEMVG
ncbi:exoribonuclease family protein [Glonium stellatum]|uniref:Exoribonuclease family protein n=1 Tax=Glonium stellatum TaxID=574774 RepID=A0A8E2FB02_9PEZI|nr:exoribonuclease family protein [Glonium stellatum]